VPPRSTVGLVDQLLGITRVDAPRFFISYKWGVPWAKNEHEISVGGAKAFAQSLARALPSAWIDSMQLANAASNACSMKSGIERSLSVIIILTPGYLGS